MAEYIDLEALIKAIASRKMHDVVPNCYEPQIRTAVSRQGQAIKQIIKEHPTADVVEVRHGEWVVNAWDGKDWCITPYIPRQHTDPFCSRCKEPAMRGSRSGQYEASTYCPNCGAKMDGKGDTE